MMRLSKSRIGLTVGMLVVLLSFFLKPPPLPASSIPGSLVRDYIEVGQRYQLPWAYLAAIDEVENQFNKASRPLIEQRAREIHWVKKEKKIEDVEEAISFLFSKEKARKMVRTASSYQWAAPMIGEDYQFPFRYQDRGRVWYNDSWGASRTYGGRRQHEGTDLMTGKGVALVAVTDGIVIRKGWNRLGGWRISLLDLNHPQIVYYYAHLQEFSPGVRVGSVVHKGEIVGKVGDSGYGPEGTTGKFAPHLHFGIYVRNGWLFRNSTAINPYPILKAWDPQR